MADKLGAPPKPKDKPKAAAKPATVTQLPTRAAQGATRPRPTPSRLKDELPTPRRSALASALRPESEQDKKLRADMQSRLIGLRVQHVSIDNKITVLREEISDLNAEKKLVRGAIQTAGMPLALFDESMEDAKTSMVELGQKELLRALIREAYGLMAQAQQDMLAGIPSGAKAGVYWNAEGYKAGIGGTGQGIPPDNVPPEHHQPWMTGWSNAMAANGAGIKVLKRDPPAKAVAAKDGSVAPKAPATAPAEPAPPKDEDKEGAPPELADAPPPTDLPKTEDDDFEAGEDELAKQTTRAAVAAGRSSELLN